MGKVLQNCVYFIICSWTVILYYRGNEEIFFSVIRKLIYIVSHAYKEEVEIKRYRPFYSLVVLGKI